MFGYKVMAEAKAHMNRDMPNESCGIVVDGKYLPCENTHDDPESNFIIAPKNYIKAEEFGGIQAVIHSHTSPPHHPSLLDMQQQMAMNVPWCILSSEVAPIWFGDGVPTPDLLGREFIFGVTDCYSLIRDWYKINRNVDLINLPREWLFWERGENLYTDNFEKAGFTYLSESTPLEIGDVFLGKHLSKKVVNHGAIYIGDGMILHHLFGRLSVREPLVNWAKLDIRVRYTP